MRELGYCQVVTCVPTSMLPKRCRQVGQETDEMLGDHADTDDDVIDEMGERGHILWIRGLSRLQHQVVYVCERQPQMYVIQLSGVV